MPFYRCECCNFSSSIKTHYTKHIATPKHIELSSQPPKPVEDDPLAELSEFLCEELMELKNSNKELKQSLQECKQLIMELKYAQPTHIAPTQATPQSIVITQAPPEEKKADDTKNPRYIETHFNEDLKYSGTPCIDAFFSINADNVVFDFEEVDELKTIADQGHGFVFNHIKKYITKKRNEGVALPFAYYKSSWYIKTEDGWKRQEKVNNKNKEPGHTDYVYDYVPSKFLFIMSKRLIDHLWDTFGRNCLMSHEGARIQSEVIDNKIHNRDVIRVLIEALE
jgi:hypothetical protein